MLLWEWEVVENLPPFESLVGQVLPLPQQLAHVIWFCLPLNDLWDLLELQEAQNQTLSSIY